MKVVLELIIILLKIFLIFLNKWFSWKAEERDRFEERMKNMANLIKEAAEDKSESINEDDYLSNIDWETKQRYDSYKKEIQEVLKKGGGISELNLVKTLGLNKRLANKNLEAIEIIIKDTSIEDKSKLLAKLLTDI